MAGTSDPLGAAYQATRLVCKHVAGLAQAMGDGKGDWRKARTLVNAIDALVTRARQGPQLLATWGPASFLVYIFSKAAEAAGENNQLLQLLVVREAQQNSEKMKKIAEKRIEDTVLSYVLYAASLIELHRALGLAPSECLENPGAQAEQTNKENAIVKRVLTCLDELVRMYIEAGSASFSRLLYSVEALARLITLRAAPAYAEAQTHLRNKDYGKALETLDRLCKSL